MDIQEISITSQQKSFLIENLSRLKGKKILILGDVCVDEYVLGHVRRISPEAPVPVLEVEKEDSRLGMSANVALNVSALGGEALMVSVVGKDTGADIFRDLCAKSGISTEFLVVDEGRPTTRKTRVMAKHHHLVRVDYELKKYLSPDVEKKLLTQLERALHECDGVIIQDYAKGVVSKDLVKKVIDLSHTYKKPVMADPHLEHPLETYAGVDLIKPNWNEALKLAGFKEDDLSLISDKVQQIGDSLMKRTGAKQVVVTRSQHGMVMFEKRDSSLVATSVPTYARQVFDVTGAGDTVIGTLALGLTSGLSLEQSCMLANFAAGVVVGKVGCVPCTTPELKEYIESV